jgi:hypothetical protein
MTGATVLLFLYIFHIILMKYSSKYEVIIKRILANFMEISELKRLAKKDMYRFHRSLKSTAISIEQLNKIEFDLQNGYVVFRET